MDIFVLFSVWQVADLQAAVTAGQWCGVGVEVSHLKKTPPPGPICLIWPLV